MEIIIILIAVSIVGYVIYQSLPATKFKKGQTLFDSGDLIEAIKVFDSIFDKHPESPAKLAECKLKGGLNWIEKSEGEAIRLFNEVIDIKKRLKESANKKLYESVEAKALLEIARIKFNNLSKGTSSDSIVKQLNENIRFIDSATKEGVENDFDILKKRHLSELAEINFSYGTQSEKSEKLVEAIQYYSIAKDFSLKSSNSKVLYNSLTRTAISKLKNKENLETIIFEDIDKSQVEYKNDFFYRYAKRLLQENNYSEAEKIISSNLNFSSPAIGRLKELLKTKKIRDAIKKVNEINYYLDQLYENSFPVDDVKNLYESLDKRIGEIKSILPTLTEKLEHLKPSLFNRLLIHYISVGQFANAINLIQKFPLFWESPELLKNLGICCYSFTAQGNLTEKNYRIVISNWLTVVFSDKVILKSLEDTTWDDEYTFTLSEAIGSSYRQHSSLPDNVNYDPITDTNISIGATQKELLLQFEELLNKKTLESSFVKTINDFYSEEKEGIEKIVSVIDNDILLASPYFAKSYGINKGIIEELDNDYREYANEESLEAGIPYLKGGSSGFVWEYATAKELVRKLISAIKNKDLDELKSVAINNKKALFEKYETMKESVENAIYNAFAAEIEEDDENEALIPLMNVCLLFSKHNEKLRFQYSNYVADFCIAKINADQIDNYKALNLMKNAFMQSSENARICKNIVTLIRYNLMDILNDNTKKVSDIYKILDEIYPKRSTMFNQEAKELFQARADILTQLKKSGADISLLTDEGPLSSLLAISSRRSLTTEGEKLKKVLSYFNKLSDSSSKNSNSNDPLHRLRQQFGLSDDLPF